MADEAVGIDATPESSTGYEGYDQIADTSPATTATTGPAAPESTVVAPATAGAPESVEQLPFHNHPRWQEVNRQLQTYRQYGDPNTIAERLQQRQAYENYILSQWQQARQAEQPKMGLEAMSEEDRQVREKILSLFPHLANSEQRTAQADTWVATQQRAIVSRGREVVTGYANTMGIQTPLGHQAMENAITAIIDSNEGALERFKGGDTTIVQHAVAALDAYVFEPIRRAAVTQYVNSKQKTVGLPRTMGTNTQGIPATPGKHKPVGDMTPQEQLDLEWSILNTQHK